MEAYLCLAYPTIRGDIVDVVMAAYGLEVFLVSKFPPCATLAYLSSFEIRQFMRSLTSLEPITVLAPSAGSPLWRQVLSKMPWGSRRRFWSRCIDLI